MAASAVPLVLLGSTNVANSISKTRADRVEALGSAQSASGVQEEHVECTCAVGADVYSLGEGDFPSAAIGSMVETSKGAIVSRDERQIRQQE